MEVTITNMIVSNKKVNKTKIKLKSLVTGFFFVVFFYVCFCSRVKGREKKNNQFTMRVSGKKKKKITRSHVVKIHFPILTLHTDTFKTFTHSLLDG